MPRPCCCLMCTEVAELEMGPRCFTIPCLPQSWGLQRKTAPGGEGLCLMGAVTHRAAAGRGLLFPGRGDGPFPEPLA